MSIPTSGTYTLSVIQLKTTWSGDSTYYSTSDNTYASSITVTFDGNTITYGDPLNYSITYDASNVLEKPYTADGVNALVVKDSTTGISYYITTNPTITTNSYIRYNSSTNTYTFGSATLNQAGTTSNDGTNVFQKNVVVCFLSGVEILTPHGLRRVEDLKAGDAILTFNDGMASQIDTITWVGQSHAYVKQNVPNDEAGFPVRVMKNAITEGVPFKDLLITSDHCLYIDGKFVPVRMLVNGSSIIYDKNHTSYDYYHVETKNHSIIQADGMLTESYLDTGNRNAFQQEGNLVTLNTKLPKNWEDHAVAPLCVSREFVEPIYQRLMARAKALNLPCTTNTSSLTTQSNICLKTSSGQILRPLRQASKIVAFLIPEHTQHVQILSNVSRHCDVIGPFVDDRRWLGVLVGKITLHNTYSILNIETHIKDPALSGWNNQERAPMRWTDGNALLPLGTTIQNTKTILTLEIIAAGPYIALQDHVEVNACA